MGTAKTPKGKSSATATKRKPTHGRPSHADVKSDAPKDLAAKKKHVRDLAKAGEWEQIKHVYGDKMVAKAKAYIEKNGSNDATQAVEISRTAPTTEPSQAITEEKKVTPQLLAKQILAMHGYDTKSEDRPKPASEEHHVNIPTRQAVPKPKSKPRSYSQRGKAASVVAAPTEASKVGQFSKAKSGADSSRTDRPSVVPTDASRSERGHKTNQTPSCTTHTPSPPVPHRSSPVAHTPSCSEFAEPGSKQIPIVIHDSPGELTEEQRRRIEERRRQALEKRKRVTTKTFDTLETSMTQRHLSEASAQPRSYSKSTFTRPPERPTRVAPLDETMLHELEIAAQITDWDIDEPTNNHPRLVTPPSARSAGDAQHNFKQDNRRQTPPTQRARPRSNAGPTTKPPSTRAMPIEKRDHRGHDHRRLSSEPITTTLSQELAIAAEIPWWDFEDDQREEQTPSYCPRSTESKSNKRPHNQAQPTNLEVGKSAQHAKLDGGQECKARHESSQGANSTREQTKELDSFIAKHFLDDKLDKTVLNFVNMMLG